MPASASQINSPEDILRAMGVLQPAQATAASAPQSTDAGSSSGGGGGGNASQGVSGTLLTGNSAFPQGLSAAGSASDQTLNSWARDLTPDEMAAYSSNQMQLPTGYSFVGVGNGAGGSGSDIDPTKVGVAGYTLAPAATDAYAGGWQNQYSAEGKFLGQQQIAPESGALKLFDKGTEALLAYLIGGAAMGAAGGPVAPGVGGAAPAGGTIGADGLATGLDSSLAVQGNSINALDAATGVDYSGETALTNAGDAVQGDSINALDGHAGESTLDEAINAPEAYNENTLPDEHDINISDENPDPTSYDYRNEMDKLSDQATRDNLVPAGTINSGVVPGDGPFWNTAPWWPDIPDPTNFDMTNPPGDPFTPDGPGNGPGGGGGTPNFDWEKFLKSFLDGLKGLNFGGDGGGGDIQLPEMPAYTPTQPSVGAGSFATPTAQGGASGSLEGIAGTLLTSKDSFGYGRTMLG
jgi:hypothetical protein